MISKPCPVTRIKLAEAIQKLYANYSIIGLQNQSILTFLNLDPQKEQETADFEEQIAAQIETIFKNKNLFIHFALSFQITFVQ